MITIDGTGYDIPVKAVRRKADFLYKYAKRSVRGDLSAELIGVYYNYEVEMGAGYIDPAEYDLLWHKLTEAEVFHEVVVWEGSGTRTFSAYFAEVSDELRKVKDGTGYFGGLTFSFIAKEPANRP